MKSYSSMARWRERGITSFFAVIFAALLTGMIMISFAAIMLREQGRSQDDELSQGAYDSAMAGVEDAKRLVAAALNNGELWSWLQSRSDDCQVISKAAHENGGSLGAPAVGSPDASEVMIRSQLSSDLAGDELIQAYTCVKIELDTPDYVLNSVNAMESKIVPLRADSTFDKVVVEWHMSGSGLAGPCGRSNVMGPLASNPVLCLQSQWAGGANTNVAPLVRAQFILPGESFTLESLDESSSGGTVFLYPDVWGGALVPSNEVHLGARLVPGNSNSSPSVSENPESIMCAQTSYLYHCRAVIAMPDPVAPEDSRNALLRLNTIYNTEPASLRVMLFDDSVSADNRVNFAGVQPRVDSTGRANDLFRRVEARLNTGADIKYPEFAVDLSAPLCKDFYVTTTASGRFPGVACNP